MLDSLVPNKISAKQMYFLSIICCADLLEVVDL